MKKVSIPLKDSVNLYHSEEQKYFLNILLIGKKKKEMNK